MLRHTTKLGARTLTSTIWKYAANPNANETIKVNQRRKHAKTNKILKTKQNKAKTKTKQANKIRLEVSWRSRSSHVHTYGGWTN